MPLDQDLARLAAREGWASEIVKYPDRGSPTRSVPGSDRGIVRRCRVHQVPQQRGPEPVRVQPGDGAGKAAPSGGRRGREGVR